MVECDSLLRVSEAIDILKIGRTAFYQLRKRGEIRTVCIGKRGLRVPRSEVARFIAERVPPAVQEQPAA